MTNPLLQDVQESAAITAVHITLPTMGLFYPADYPHQVLADGVDVAEVEIHPIGIIAEIVSKDPFLLASGKGLPRIINQVCPSIQHPESLSEVDLEAILLGARIASYGPKMKIEHTCTNPATQKGEDGKSEEPVCREKNPVEIDLTDHIQNYQPMEIDVESDDHSGWLMTFEEIRGQRVHLRPMVYDMTMEVLKRSLSMNRIYQDVAERPATDLMEDEETIVKYADMVEKTMDQHVLSLNGSILYVENSQGLRTYDREHIEQWLMHVPSTVTEALRVRLNELTANDEERKYSSYECPHCGHKNKIAVEMDPQKLFFYEQQGSDPPKKSTRSSKKKKPIRRTQ